MTEIPLNNAPPADQQVEVDPETLKKRIETIVSEHGREIGSKDHFVTGGINPCTALFLANNGSVEAKLVSVETEVEPLRHTTERYVFRDGKVNLTILRGPVWHLKDGPVEHSKTSIKPEIEEVEYVVSVDLTKLSRILASLS